MHHFKLAQQVILDGKHWARVVSHRDPHWVGIVRDGGQSMRVAPSRLRPAQPSEKR